MHGCRLSPGKIYLPFKIMKNTKSQTCFSPWTVLMTKMIFCKKKKKKKKLKYFSESKIWRHFSPATMAGYPKLDAFSSAYRYFCITCCSDSRLTTIDFKELLYLMPLFFYLCRIYNAVIYFILFIFYFLL